MWRVKLPSPRYANCIVNGTQTISPADNGAIGAAGVDDEWFAVIKEQKLAERCKIPAGPREGDASSRSATPTSTPSYFWTVMSQNGNAPSKLGTDNECLPYCYLTPGHLESPTPLLWNGTGTAGYPPAVNASSARCIHNTAAATPAVLPTAYQEQGKIESTFNGQPENQGKVMVLYTDPTDPKLAGGFNWTFELDADLAVPEAEFPMDRSLGIFSWEYDEARGAGVVRMYQRVSAQYAWICTYFGADVAEGRVETSNSFKEISSTTAALPTIVKPRNCLSVCTNRWRNHRS